MTKSSAYRRGELVRAVFSILMEHPEGLPVKSVFKELEKRVEMTDAERGDFEKAPGVRRFEFRVRFATIKAVKAGWLVKTKGEWSLTEAGRNAYLSLRHPEQFEREAGRLYREWADKRGDGGEHEEEDDEPDDTDSASPSTAIEEATENAWREVQEHLTSMPPYDFQQLVGALLTGMGYHVAWIAPPGKDGGIDVLAHTDPLGTRGPRIKVQVKRQQTKVSVEGLRSFMALLGDQDVGLFVSTGGFTKDAELEARQQEKRQVTLVDLERLFDLWVEHYGKIPETERAFLPLRPIYYLAPTD